jgi:hypothetical protein
VTKGAVEILHPDCFVYKADFITSSDHAALVDFLGTVPVMASEDRDIRQQFAFTSLVFDGVVVTGRLEAAAGWPVWMDARPGRGVDMPAPLSDLASRISEDLVSTRALWLAARCPSTPFSSVYVDRYPPGGSFVAHTDRSCYGPVIAGVSLGKGTCQLSFDLPDGTVFAQRLSPGSLYAFTGSLRYPPCAHRVDHVSALRFGVTFRFADGTLSTSGCPQ